MNQLTKEELHAHDLQVCAYHEAGHRIMYRRFGGDGDAVVWKNLSGNPDEMAWRAHFRPRTCPQVMHDLAKRAGFPAADLPDNWRVLYGMAGLVAEEILRGETDPEFVAGALYVEIVCGEVSASDLESIGISNIDDFEFDSEVVETAWRYLTEDWSLVQHDAEYLIADAVSLEPQSVVNGQPKLEL